MKRLYSTISKALMLLTTALLLFICVGMLSFTDSAYADGGLSGMPDDEQYVFTIEMDVNGRAASGDDDYDMFEISSNNSIVHNNSKRLRTRRIAMSSLLIGYTELNRDSLPMAAVNYTDRNFDFAVDSADNQYNNYLKVVLNRENTRSEYIELTALRYKNPVSVRLTAYRNSNGATIANCPESITMYLKIIIDSTFVSATDNSVTAGIDDAKTLYITDDDGHIEGSTLNNGTTVTFDVANLVSSDAVGGAKREFYYRNRDKNGENTPLRERVGSDVSWLLRDATHLTVDSIQGISSGNFTGNQVIIVPAANCTNVSIEGGIVTPKIVINVSFTETIVNSVDSRMGQDAFWTQPHYLYFTLKSTTIDQVEHTVRIGKAVRFSTSGAPVAKSTPDIVTDLNASSGYTYQVGSADNEAHSVDGFGAVLVSPSHIADYPSSSEFIQSFDESLEPVCEPAGQTVEIKFVADAYPVIDPETQQVTYTPSWLITGKQRGDVVITFTIQYGGSNTLEVPVSFSVYGNYTISLTTIKGKRAQTYRTTTAAEFEALTKDKYFMTGVSVAEGDAAQVDFNSGIMTLTPKADGDVRLKFEFANLNGKTVVVYSTVRIDYSANGFFVMFEDWQAWLIIAAAIVVGVGLILLVIWLFIRSVSKRREAELATTAPTSSYIIKLNSTIAAAQAQQRAATQPFPNTQTQMLQLGVGSTSAATQPSDALQLGAAPPPPAGVNTTATEASTSYPSTDDKITPPPAETEEIYIPLTDEELLERIYVEKYEPRGMVRRTFFKSKDLQARELEKEKERIREEVRNGTPIEEAIKSKAQREQEGGAVVPDVAPEEVKEEITIVTVLGFDPQSPLLPEEEPLTPEEGAAPEVVKLQEAERRLARVEAEYKVVCERLNKATDVTSKKTGEVESDEKAIDNKKEYAETLKEDMTQLEIKLATAKNKDKEKINKDLESKERVQKDTLAAVEKLTGELTEKRQLVEELEAVTQKLTTDKETYEQTVEQAKTALEDAQNDHRLYLERVEMAQKAQAKRESVEELNPMLLSVNTLDKEMRDLENQIDKDSKDKDTFKTEVASIQAQLLTTNDVEIIGNLSTRINELNKSAANLDKAISANKKLQADKNIQFTKDRKRANDFIERKELSVDDVIAAEDEIIGQLALDEILETTKLEQAQAEEDVAKYQAMVDEFIETGDSKVLELAVKTSEDIKAAEDAVLQADTELSELTARMESATDDEKLMMSIDQMSLTERLEELKKTLEEVTAQSTKDKLEFQMNRDRELEDLREQLATAQETYQQATDKLNDLTNNTKPTDLIISGSGVISQDQKKLEQENLKKQLQETKDILEQANIQAKMAQMEAERKIVEAQKASDASKEEAERAAQEAIAAAEEAKRAAEERAEEEANRAREEMERAKREAEEAAERARKEAEEEAERARQEAERAREELEQAKREAEEAAERARKEAEEEAERVRREAEEAAEKARIEAEEAAEQAKREAEEQAEKARKEAEEQAERERKEKEEREARIAEKVNKRKQEILTLRNDLKQINDEQSAKELREKFYAVQMALDDDEKTSSELKDLITKSMDDATHAGELAVYKAMANKAPRRIVKKVTERVNRIPKKRPAGSHPAGARPAGARPRPAGARPAGARPAGARPTRPAGARPAGARPAGARPAGTRPPQGANRRPPNRPEK